MLKFQQLHYNKNLLKCQQVLKILPIETGKNPLILLIIPFTVFLAVSIGLVIAVLMPFQTFEAAKAEAMRSAIEEGKQLKENKEEQK